MQRTLRPFLVTVLCAWMALFVTAVLTSQQHPGARWIWTAAFPALLLETLFYAGSVFENSRNRFSALALGWRGKAVLLWVSALMPYLVFSLGTGTFLPNAFFLLAGVTAVYAFWFAVCPRRIAYDVGFLVLAALPLLTHLFVRVYRSPDAHLRLDILGHLMWIRVGMMALLVLREWNAGPVSLWPTAREWRVGVLWFTLAIVPSCALAFALQAVVFHPVSGSAARIAGVAVGLFAGYFAIMIGEELFFRGFILKALLRLWRSPLPAVGVSALCFGFVHLWFRHYPDWQWACVAGVLGLACGFAYVQAGSVRASLVTHTLTIVVWRLLFR